MEWLVYALLSAFFGALTAIFGKVGVRDLDANVATAVRSVVIVCFAFGLVAAQGNLRQLGTLSRPALLFLLLSGAATGLSWIFYFRALQVGNAAQVSPIDKLSLVFTIALAGLFLQEKVTPVMVLGAGLMTLGAVLIGSGK